MSQQLPPRAPPGPPRGAVAYIDPQHWWLIEVRDHERNWARRDGSIGDVGRAPSNGPPPVADLSATKAVVRHPHGELTLAWRLWKGTRRIRARGP